MLVRFDAEATGSGGVAEVFSVTSARDDPISKLRVGKKRRRVNRSGKVVKNSLLSSMLLGVAKHQD